ncbi:MAG TPA: UDP-3-O-(3-hydroxymyristoyl)glucosamine N-acyltransferase [Tepidisphaeraceae bacterium]|jgi:UDP-3-O-[3-hydroxymyristoyl] glucosamine N-acyltransferase
MKLAELAQKIEADVVGDPEIEITSCATLDQAQPGQLSFLSNAKYAKQLETTKASAIVVSKNVTSTHLALLKAADPYYAFTQAVVLLHGYRQHPHTGVHNRANVDGTATIGEGTVIYPGCYVGPRVKVGSNCVLYPNVVVYDDCVLGDRVTIHANTTIGQDGFGYATHKGIHHKIPQIGNVIIEDDVEIGSNCAIERATLGSTIIGKGTKFCDLIAIGHGSKVGEHCLFVAQVGLAGSVTTGHHVTIAGQVGVAGHLKIGNNVTIAAQSGVIEDLEDQKIYLGSPAMPGGQARRVYTIFQQLPELVDRIKHIEQKIEEIS